MQHPCERENQRVEPCAAARSHRAPNDGERAVVRGIVRHTADEHAAGSKIARQLVKQRARIARDQMEHAVGHDEVERSAVERHVVGLPERRGRPLERGALDRGGDVDGRNIDAEHRGGRMRRRDGAREASGSASEIQDRVRRTRHGVGHDARHACGPLGRRAEPAILERLTLPDGRGHRLAARTGTHPPSRSARADESRRRAWRWPR